MLHVVLDQTPCIFKRQRRSRPNALAFQRLVPALNLAVGLNNQMRRIATLGIDVSEQPIPTIRCTGKNSNSSPTAKTAKELDRPRRARSVRGDRCGAIAFSSGGLDRTGEASRGMEVRASPGQV
jgi:hypothetical protein